MAEAAGIVNRAGRGDATAFQAVIAGRPAEVQALSLAVRDLVYEAFPDAVEVIWPQQGTVGWGIGPKKMSEQFAYFAAFARHVRLGFYRGADLGDPDGLLETDSANKGPMRSLRITSREQIADPALRRLLDAAIQQLRTRP